MNGCHCKRCRLQRSAAFKHGVATAAAVLLLIFVLVLLTGCAWQKAHTVPADAWPVIRYDAAVEAFENETDWRAHGVGTPLDEWEGR